MVKLTLTPEQYVDLFNQYAKDAGNQIIRCHIEHLGELAREQADLAAAAEDAGKERFLERQATYLAEQAALKTVDQKGGESYTNCMRSFSAGSSWLWMCSKIRTAIKFEVNLRATVKGTKHWLYPNLSEVNKAVSAIRSAKAKEEAHRRKADKEQAKSNGEADKESKFSGTEAQRLSQLMESLEVPEIVRKHMTRLTDSVSNVDYGRRTKGGDQVSGAVCHALQSAYKTIQDIVDSQSEKTGEARTRTSKAIDELNAELADEQNAPESAPEQPAKA